MPAWLDRVLGKNEEPSFDPHDLGARRSDPTLGALEPIPELYSRRFTPRRLLFYFFVLVVVVAIFRVGGNRSGPALTTSCTTPAFSVGSTDVKAFGVIHWSATGPNGSRVVFGLDTKALPTSLSDGLVASPPALKGCKASGQFGVRVSSGNHVLTVYDVSPAGAVRILGTRKVTID